MVCQRDEAVAKASGNEKLLFVFFRQLYADPLLVRRAAFAQVYGYVENGTASAAHQLGLTPFAFLEMDASQCAFDRLLFFIILYNNFFNIFQYCFKSRKIYMLIILHNIFRKYLFSKCIFNIFFSRKIFSSNSNI